MEPYRFRCPYCEKKFVNRRAEFVGHWMKCAQCGSPVKVPSADSVEWLGAPTPGKKGPRPRPQSKSLPTIPHRPDDPYIQPAVLGKTAEVELPDLTERPVPPLD